MNRYRAIIYILITSFLLSVSPAAIPASSLHLIYQDNLWGYIDSAGKIKIKPEFIFAEEFSEGLAAVKNRGRSRKVGSVILMNPAKWSLKPPSNGPNPSRPIWQRFLRKGNTVLSTQAVNLRSPLCLTMPSPFQKVWQQSNRMASGDVSINPVRWMISPTFSQPPHFSEGLAAVQIDKPVGLYRYPWSNGHTTPI